MDLWGILNYLDHKSKINELYYLQFVSLNSLYRLGSKLALKMVAKVYTKVFYQKKFRALVWTL